MDTHPASPPGISPIATTRSKMPPLAKVVGERLRRRRKALGLEVAVLAAQVAVKADTLHLYEAGAARVPAATLLALGEALGVPLHHFFLPNEETPPGPVAVAVSAAEPSITNDAEALVVAYLRITDRSLQRAILVGLQALAEGQD